MNDPITLKLNADKYIDSAIKMNPQNLNYKKLKAEFRSRYKKPTDDRPPAGL